MNKVLLAIWRLAKVFYLFFIFIGIYFTYITWITSAPYDYNTYSYKVNCYNGKSFDPTSKPMERTTNVNAPDTFNDLELKSECEYGTAWFIGLATRLPKNYELGITTYSNNLRSPIDQIVATIKFFILYFASLELLRRIFLYVLLGEKLFTFNPYLEILKRYKNGRGITPA